VLRFVVDPASKTSIDMPAPKERIAAGTTAARGELSVDLEDLTRTRGRVDVDLTTLQTRTFGDASKDKAQTEHAHNWLEAGDLVTPEVKEANRWVTFTIRGVDSAGAHRLDEIPVEHAGGDETRTVAVVATGDVSLHGHTVKKDVPLSVVFHYPAGQSTSGAPTRLDIAARSPLRLVLADHDVKPRDGLGKLAQASFSLLGTKVAETADVSLDLHATPATLAP
jgi:hypothetical protein